MRLLLTAESIHNKTIERALRELLEKPSRECKLVYITTSQNAAVGDKSWFIENVNNAYNVGWKSFELIDIAAMIDLPKEMWWDRIEAADVIFMGGGANFYLGYWLERSGLMQALPRLLKSKVYVGSSAGSMILSKTIMTASQPLKRLAAGANNVSLQELGPEGQRSPNSLQLVDFAIRPHYTSTNYPYITDGLLQKTADEANCKIYALDNDSALKITDETVEIVSEGRWKIFTPAV